MAMFNADLAGGGSTVEIDGVAYDGDLKLVKKTINISLPNLPFELVAGSAVVYEDEIHAFGGNKKESTYTKHIKFNGTEWETVSTLPCRADRNSVVVYRDKIYILYSNNFYKWNGSTWTQLNPPYNSSAASWMITVHSDRIYAIGKHYSDAMFYYDGSSWTDTNKSVYKATYKGSVVSGDGIYLVGSSRGDTNYWLKVEKMDTTSYTKTSLPTVPYNLIKSIAEYINGELHIIGTTHNSTEYINGTNYYDFSRSFYHYVFRNDVWVKLNDVPHACGGGASTIVDGCICLVGSGITSYGSSNGDGGIYLFGKNVTIIDKPVYELAS